MAVALESLMGERPPGSYTTPRRTSPGMGNFAWVRLGEGSLQARTTSLQLQNTKYSLTRWHRGLENGPRPPTVLMLPGTTVAPLGLRGLDT